MKIKIRRISKKEKLGISGIRPIKYKYRQRMVKGKRLRKRLTN